MMRQKITLALIGLALVPEWATALGGRRLCFAPPPPCPPRIVFVPPCLPPISVAPPNYSIVPAPSVQVEPATAVPPSKPEPPKTDAAPAAPRPVSPGVPPGNSATDPGGAVKPSEFARPLTAEPTDPKPAPKPDPAAGGSPKKDIPKPQVPQIPSTGGTSTPPKGDDVRIPALIPQLPGADVPRLAIPQIPVEPSDKSKSGTSTSKASPLTDGAKVEVFPVDGAAPGPGSKRTVGFFNHTDRDLTLTVEGDTLTLPRRHFVSASVPLKFNWKLDGNERRTEIPASAPGVEVVIRK
jgi:hypothetical protein